MPPLAADHPNQSSAVLEMKLSACDGGDMTSKDSLRALTLGFAVAQALTLSACDDATQPMSDGAASSSMQTASPTATSAAGAMATSAAGAKAPMGATGTMASRPSAATTPSSVAANGGSPAAAAAGSSGAAADSSKPASMAAAGASAAAGAGAGGATGGAAGSGDAAAGAGGGTGVAMELPDLGKGDGSDVVTIGDSWMNFAINGGGIEAALDRAGTKYGHYAFPGTLLLNGQIPSQYDQAKSAHPKIATVIMTGGGNDVMSSGGCDTKEKCVETTQKIIDGIDELYMKMVADGVSSAVLIDYSKFAGSGPKDTRPDILPTPTTCTTGKLRCLVIETTDIVGAADLVDGVHPTMAATDRIAKRTLETMEKQGVRR